MVLSQTLAVLWSLGGIAMATGQDDGARTASATAPAAGGTAPTAGVRADGPPGTGVDDLLAQVARGNAEALAAVCDQVAGPVYGLVSRIVGDQARAEQVTGEVLVEVWRTASRFSPAAGSGLAWIIAIAQRHAVRAARSMPARGPAAATGSAEAAAGPGERTGTALLTHPGLAELPVPQREAILLACCGYTWPEIADLAGAPVGTVTGWLHHGLLRLNNQDATASM
jgi:RNA polymerase sigma-70 factor (ECF subfamily)